MIRFYIVSNVPYLFEDAGKFKVVEQHEYSLSYADISVIKTYALKWFYSQVNGFEPITLEQLSEDKSKVVTEKYEYYLACEYFPEMHEGMVLIEGKKAFAPSHKQEVKFTEVPNGWVYNGFSTL